LNRIVLEAEVASVNVWHAWQVVIVFEGHAELFLEVHALPKLVGGLAVDGKGEGLVVGLRRDGVHEVTILGLVLVLLAALMIPADGAEVDGLRFCVNDHWELSMV